MKRFFVSLAVGLAIAQSISSVVFAQSPTRYPTPAEIQRIIRDFQTRAASPPFSGECCGGWEADTRSQSEKQALESFVRGWSQFNPEIVPFLGHWVNNDADIVVYPSKTHEQVCVVWMTPVPQYYFNQGSFSNGQIRITNGRLKNHILLHQRNPKGNVFLLDASVRNGRADAYPGSDIYTYPKHPALSFSWLPRSVVQQMNAAECSASLPR